MLVKRISFVAISSVAVFAATLDLAVAGESTIARKAKWQPWAEIGVYRANRAEARRGEMAFWAPLLQGSNAVFFAEADGRIFEGGDQREGNLALGLRGMSGNGWNLGAWAGLDRRRSETFNIFNQVAGGIELLSSDWDIRINGYFPLNDAEPVSSITSGSAESTVEIVDNALYLVPGLLTRTEIHELAFRGVDAEVGWRVPLASLFEGDTAEAGAPSSHQSSATRFDLRIFAGGYYFENTDFPDAITGPRLRAELQFTDIIPFLSGSQLTLEAAWQHDDVRDERTEIGARLRIPLGASPDTTPLTPQEERMTEHLRRDTDVVARTQQDQTSVGGGAPELTMDADTDVVFDHVATVANGGDLQAALDAAGSNSLIIVQGGASNFGPISMSANQTLLGGGGSINVKGVTSGTEATYTAPGTRPSFFTSDDFHHLITAADRTHLAHVSIGGPDGFQFIGDHDRVGYALYSTASMVVIDDVIVHDLSHGIQLWENDINIIVKNSYFSDLYFGLFTQYNNANIAFYENTFNDLYASVFVIEAHSSSHDNVITVKDNLLTGNFSYYLFNFWEGNTVLHPDSTGNISTTTPGHGICNLITGNVTGTIEFTSPAMSVSSASCE